MAGLFDLDPIDSYGEGLVLSGELTLLAQKALAIPIEGECGRTPTKATQIVTGSGEGEIALAGRDDEITSADTLFII